MKYNDVVDLALQSTGAQMSNLLSFIWEKDRDGYDLLEFDPRGIELIETWDAKANVMSSPSYIYKATSAASPLAVEILERCGAGFFYEVYDADRSTGSEPYNVLIPRGEELVQYHPLDEHPAIFMELAETPMNPEGVKSFKDKFGPLRDYSGLEIPEAWYSEMRTIRKAVRSWEKGKKSGSVRTWVKSFNREIGWGEHRSSASVQLISTDDPLSPNLAVVPDNLIAAIWLQFAQQVSSSTGLRRCNWCGTWFVFGTGTGRRRSAHFCADRCRQAAHRKQKGKGK